jgi:hypothetical protein
MGSRSAVAKARAALSMAFAGRDDRFAIGNLWQSGTALAGSAGAIFRILVGKASVIIACQARRRLGLIIPRILAANRVGSA